MNQKKDLNREDLPYYIAPPIFEQLRKGYKKVTTADQDRIYVVTGREGLGKSIETFKYLLCLRLVWKWLRL